MEAPIEEELFAACSGEGATCKDRALNVSCRCSWSEAIVFAGHGTHDGSGEAGLARFGAISKSVKKMRILGSAALSLCYIAAGRFDAYIESRIYVWDFAAAQLILQEAGGQTMYTPADEKSGAIIAWNGLLPLSDLGLA